MSRSGIQFSFSDGNLRAFLAIAHYKQFSIAARELHISQPALSIQIKQMETTLKAKLFKRHARGVELTDLGLELLVYAKARQQLDLTFQTRIEKRNAKGLSGNIKIAGHYSIIKHVAIPCLSDLIRKNLHLQIQCLVREDIELPDTLMTGDADFVFLQYRIDRPNISSHFLGYEEYIAVEPKRSDFRANVFLDSDPRDTLVQRFFQKHDMQVPKHERSFLHDESGILQGVELGLGRAIVAKNEIRPGSKVRQIHKFKPYFLESHLHYFEGSVSSELHQEVIKYFQQNSSRFLKSKG